MKVLSILIGAALIVLGGVVLFQGLSFTEKETVFQIGPIKAEVSKERAIPTWAGGVALVAGLVLVAVGVRK